MLSRRNHSKVYIQGRRIIALLCGMSSADELRSEKHEMRLVKRQLHLIAPAVERERARESMHVFLEDSPMRTSSRRVLDKTVFAESSEVTLVFSTRLTSEKRVLFRGEAVRDERGAKSSSLENL